MKQYIRIYITIFILWTLVGVFSKLLFLVMYYSLIGEATLFDYLFVIYYGLKLDVAIAGYFTVVPTLMLIIMQWYNGKVIRWLWRGYFILTASVTSLAYIANLGLYGYWGFPLDNTPLLYIKTSPADALASMTWMQLLIATISVIIIAIFIAYVFIKFTGYAFIEYVKKDVRYGKTVTCTALVLLLCMLIIPIRGGFGTGTNHTGSVYFSSNIRLNHAAVNPIFCFIESVSHQSQNLSNMYRFMDEKQAEVLFNELSYTLSRADTVKVPEAFSEIRPGANVMLICLESFSKFIMDEGGHVKGVTPTINRLSSEAVYFKNFYANSFRTDRAMISVFSGLPAQPTMSVMDLPHISNNLPSIARSLLHNGYSTTFYYGGDTNYSNMRSYLMATGFHNIVSEEDFSYKERSTKWGVPDGIVFDRVLKDITCYTQPFFIGIMTLSSHEPFDVPYKSDKEPILNAFAYTDHCLGEFLDKLKSLPCWKNTLVVIVPDHLGAYPENPDNYQLWRYEIPLIMTGGVIKGPWQSDTIGSQIDISATILGLLGVKHDDFPFSKDLLDSKAPHFAFFTFPDAMGMVTSTSISIYDNVSCKNVKAEGADTEHTTLKAKAYLQKLYDIISK